MPKLNPNDKERARFHLGLSCIVNIDVGDVIRFEQAITEIPSDYIVRKIRELLDRCDKTYENLDMVTNEGRSVSELITGDINRSVIRTEYREQQRIWWAEYQKVTDRLASMLGCANYNHEGMERYKHSAVPMGATINGATVVATLGKSSGLALASTVAKKFIGKLNTSFNRF